MREQRPPVLRVVRGEPDAAELAALTAVLNVARHGARTTVPDTTRSTWADHTSRMRRAPRPGPGAWRASGLPS
jgi:hypothetical protein